MRLSRFAALVLVVFQASCASFGGGPPPLPPLLDPDGLAMTTIAPAHYKVHFETSQGDFVVEVDRAWAPLGADRFFNLVRHGFYDGAHFFRVLPGFVVQFGISADALVTDALRGAYIPDDPTVESNRRGTLSFATAGPDTRTTQVFINLVDNGRLDPMGFTPFARVVGGMDTIDAIHGGYGEGAPMGRGPDQNRLEREGSAYLVDEFPELDFIHRARIVPD